MLGPVPDEPIDNKELADQLPAQAAGPSHGDNPTVASAHGRPIQLCYRAGLDDVAQPEQRLRHRSDRTFPARGWRAGHRPSTGSGPAPHVHPRRAGRPPAVVSGDGSPPTRNRRLRDHVRQAVPPPHQGKMAVGVGTNRFRGQSTADRIHPNTVCVRLREPAPIMIMHKLRSLECCRHLGLREGATPQPSMNAIREQTPIKPQTREGRDTDRGRHRGHAMGTDQAAKKGANPGRHPSLSH